MTDEEKITVSEQKISHIKTKMILDLPFFGILMAKLENRPSDQTETIGIDEHHLMYSPDFITAETTTDTLLLFMFLHETLHLVYGHLRRRKNKDVVAWNLASDIVVNNTIVFDLPEGNRFEEIVKNYTHDFELKDNTTEEIYEMMQPSSAETMSEELENDQEENDLDDTEKNEKESHEGDKNDKDEKEAEETEETYTSQSQSEEQKKGKKQGEGASEENSQNQGEGKGGDHGSGNHGSGGKNLQKKKNKTETMVSTHLFWDNIEDSKEAEDDIFITIRNAYEMAKTHSSTPGFIEAIVTEFFEPKKNWRTLLANFTEPVYPDYTFHPPSDLFPTFDFIMPEERICDDGILDIYFYIDSSGSVPETLLREMASELRACYEQFGDRSIVYYGDFAMEASEPKLLEDPKSLHFEMHGGTDPACVFYKLKEIDKLKEARAIVILTDGFFKPISMNLAEGVDVLWVIAEGGTGEFLANWRDVIFV
ncbi:MAG: VWA-like domain-containing protein [Bacillota bacterium]